MVVSYRLPLQARFPTGLLLACIFACDAGRVSAPTGGTGETGETGPGNDSDANDSVAVERCGDADLEWMTGHKTHFTSYPDPGSEECDEFNGCEWEGLFAGCSSKRPESWVAETNIAAVYPLFRDLRHHELCIRAGGAVMIVNVIDTCSDNDCDGCCSQNQGTKDALIDLEDYTNERWGRSDGGLEWADLGPRADPVCD